MTSSIFFWALLSQKDLSFVYLSPWLSKTLDTEDDLLLGTSFFDYFHPEEREMARHDLSELVKKKTISCSVTRYFIIFFLYQNFSFIRNFFFFYKKKIYNIFFFFFYFF